jgi:hypothetical protein
VARTVLLDDGTTAEEPGLLPPPGRTVMPGDWGDALGTDFRGQVRYTRRFQCPTGLDHGARVVLRIDQADAWGCVSLNGHLLGTLRAIEGPGRFDVTDRLQDRNELVVDVELPRQTAGSAPLSRPASRAGQPGGLVGGVCLEIS